MNKRGPKPKIRSRAKSSPIPDPPGHLSDTERTEFVRVANVLHDAGLLSAADVDIIALYARWHGSWTQANEHVAEHGQVITTKTGAIKPNPSVNISNTASREMLKCLNALGMTPASRKAVERVERHEDDPIAKLMAW
ncbi:phage terminase small subunit P27 family [Tautonia sociabilis]|uniref:Phage terminase small subunit P27 family n=1 Tax=Tautonia sociabilis TaxID=2080755 RepID=A0A432MJL9_9BACT|nr:phage terminase small subunit P27 family [Tautonia sociabilis]RUL87604.1 phage terminase small subunit P27 family [Tautonia sociabilis]